MTTILNSSLKTISLLNPLRKLGSKCRLVGYIKEALEIDCLFMWQVLINRINQASLIKYKLIDVMCCSWLEGIDELRKLQEQGELLSDSFFFYLDPPFFEEANALYRHYFTEDDHKGLRDYLLKLNDKFISSYDNAQQMETLYGIAHKNGPNGAHYDYIELLYGLVKISERRRGKEVIISNLKQLPKREESS